MVTQLLGAAIPFQGATSPTYRWSTVPSDSDAAVSIRGTSGLNLYLLISPTLIWGTDWTPWYEAQCHPIPSWERVPAGTRHLQSYSPLSIWKEVKLVDIDLQSFTKGKRSFLVLISEFLMVLTASASISTSKCWIPGAIPESQELSHRLQACPIYLP